MIAEAAAGPVVVLGATGGTGAYVVQELLKRNFPVRVISRKREKAQSQFGDDVEIAVSDVTDPETLQGVFADAQAVIDTVGVKPGWVSEDKIEEIEYQGTINILGAAKAEGFAGRFFYMGAIGTERWSPVSGLLNTIKGNTLKWRRRAERQIRESGLDYAIVHAGVLSDTSKPARTTRISQRRLRMWPWRRIGRADVAHVFVEALQHPRARNVTFDAIWGAKHDEAAVEEQLDRLVPDGQPPRSQ